MEGIKGYNRQQRIAEAQARVEAEAEAQADQVEEANEKDHREQHRPGPDGGGAQAPDSAGLCDSSGRWHEGKLAMDSLLMRDLLPTPAWPRGGHALLH